MNRRAFFSALTAFAAAATLDPERLLWTSGKKLISIPAPPRLLSVEEMLDAALVRLGYFRPLNQGQLADAFLEMTRMVDRSMGSPVDRVRAYIDSSVAVSEACFWEDRQFKPWTAPPHTRRLDRML
jgi:hypothetical protein